METLIEIPALESKIEQELVKHNVTDSVLAALKDKYAGMKLRSLDDKEMYLEIKEAAKECAKVRNIIVKCCKLGREEAIKIQKLWVFKERETVARVTEVEAPLDAEIEMFNAEVERKALEEKKRQEEAYMQRTQALTRMGALYSNGCFELGGFSIEGNLVKESSEDIWQSEVLPRFTEEYNKSQDEIIKTERLKAEKEAEIKRQQEEFQIKQREFEAEQAEFRKQKEEAERKIRDEAAEKDRESLRIRNEIQNKRFTILIPHNPDGTGVNMQALWMLSEDEFNSICDSKKKEFELKQEARNKEIEERAAQKERERIQEEQRQAEIKRQQIERQRAEELDRSADKVKFADLISHFEAIKVPEMRSGQYRKKVASIRALLEEILSFKPQANV